MASIEAKSQHAILGNLGGSLSAMLGGTAFRLRSVADYGGTCHAVHLRSGWNPTLQMLKPSLQHNIFCAERFTPGKSRGSVPSRPGLAETGHVWFHPTSFFLLRSANYEGQVELRRTGRNQTYFSELHARNRPLLIIIQYRLYSRRVYSNAIRKKHFKKKTPHVVRHGETMRGKRRHKGKKVIKTII